MFRQSFRKYAQIRSHLPSIRQTSLRKDSKLSSTAMELQRTRKSIQACSPSSHFHSYLRSCLVILAMDSLYL